MQDVRWKQRFNNFRKAFQSLEDAVVLANKRKLSDLEEQGLIQSFEFTHELAWNVLKDYLEYQGIVGLIGSKDATREAFKNQLIENGEDWMEMILDRNRTSHTYDLKIAQMVVSHILQRYYPSFVAFSRKMSGLTEG